MIYPLEYILLLYSGLRIGGDKMKNLKGAITCLKMTETKPNFSELGRVYGVDRRTAKKMKVKMQSLIHVINLLN